ncbi:MAG: undecaprenyldiphospho-muramoylpentapeptide beta-N-acetylglucosaminyltransferase [Bacteroidales bacterium]|nr:undecaprenyldiphospho-muramoylpentapeptide beta-N-acetylglucosaminyltransferase [Bacteroidales bacterium]
MSALRVIISGGGTGGHIFPAISIANEIRSKRPDAEILFVGAEGRMEMQRVPAAGYEIKGLPIAGFDRKRLWRNFGVLLKIWKSKRIARRIVSNFSPHVAVGVGGYASGPTLSVCEDLGIPTLLQEQNSYAGITNKLLAKRAKQICVAYEGMERFFPKERILLTGNPVRQALLSSSLHRSEAFRSLGLDEGKRTILIIGGSLGARTLNEAVLSHLATIAATEDVQILWQTGKFYAAEIAQRLQQTTCPSNLIVTEFVSDMAAAYAVADLVVSRAGASSISELCLLGKPSILVPSPNVAEDHQTHNAMALVKQEAAMLVKDTEALTQLLPTAIQLVRDTSRLQEIGKQAIKLGKPNAASDIADAVIALAEGKKLGN